MSSVCCGIGLCLIHGHCIDELPFSAQYNRSTMKINGYFAPITAITWLVRLSSRYSWPVILGFLLVAIISMGLGAALIWFFK